MGTMDGGMSHSGQRSSGDLNLTWWWISPGVWSQQNGRPVGAEIGDDNDNRLEKDGDTMNLEECGGVKLHVASPHQESRWKCRWQERCYSQAPAMRAQAGHLYTFHISFQPAIVLQSNLSLSVLTISLSWG